MTSGHTTPLPSKGFSARQETAAGVPRRGRHRRRRSVTRVGVLAAVLPFLAVPVAEAASVQPTPSTVLTLSPFSTGATMADQLQGSLCRAPNTCVPVNWSPTLLVPAGVVALEAAMGAQSADPYTVFAYSQGAEVVEQWLKKHANDPNAPDPKNVKFVLIGNPTRPYGGTGSMFGEVLPQTDYQVLDISREYDFASDFPNKPFSPYFMLAVANAAVGLFAVHLEYQDVDMNNPANLQWKVGNTTYVLVPTPVLPLLAPLQIMGIDPTALNAVLKPLVDSAYDRTYGGTVSPQPMSVTSAPATQSAPPAPAVEPAMSSHVAEPQSRSALTSSAPATAVVDVAAAADATEPDQVTDSADAGQPERRITDGNKFEPNPTSPIGTRSVGGQGRSGSKPVGSVLGKIVKGLKKALTHD